MASEETKPPGFDWLYPSLLSVEELVSTLKARYIKVDVLQRCQKDELVELYNKYVIPLPQRKYRLNRRGREMTKKQILSAKKRRLDKLDTAHDEGQPVEKKQGLITSHGMTSRSDVGERLKPPPSCVNLEKKTIKLGASSSSHGTQVTSNLKNLSIKNSGKVSDTSCSPEKKVKLNSHVTDSSVNESKGQNEDEVEGSDENSTAVSSDKSSSEIIDMETDSTVQNEEKVDKKRIKKISWP